MSESRRAWVVWAVGVFAYIVAVMHRTTFGVAGLDAIDRFDLSASVLALLPVLQLMVYAALQVPVGVLLDHVGSRRLLITGAAVMAISQVITGLATNVEAAIAGRILLGAGDALTFVSVLRIVIAWFPPSRVPVITQLTSLIGQAGQVLSAVPFVAVLGLFGWTPAFLSAAAIGLLAGVLGVVVWRDSPTVRAMSISGRSSRSVRQGLLIAWRHPGTRLGMWTHFTTMFSTVAFALLWGFPFLVSGQGQSEHTAGWLITVVVAAGLISGPFVGIMVQRHPMRRSWLVLGVIGTNAAAWTAVLAWPGRSPIWLLIVLMVSLALSGPGSTIGFDFARTFNSPTHLGTASGIVNVGGFAASLCAILAIGLILDVRGGGADGYGLEDFRVALSVQYLLWAGGLVGILQSRRAVRRRMADQGVVVAPIRDVIGLRRRR